MNGAPVLNAMAAETCLFLLEFEGFSRNLSVAHVVRAFSTCRETHANFVRHRAWYFGLWARHALPEHLSDVVRGVLRATVVPGPGFDDLLHAIVDSGSAPRVVGHNECVVVEAARRGHHETLVCLAEFSSMATVCAALSQASRAGFDALANMLCFESITDPAHRELMFGALLNSRGATPVLCDIFARMGACSVGELEYVYTLVYWTLMRLSNVPHEALPSHVLLLTDVRMRAFEALLDRTNGALVLDVACADAVLFLAASEFWLGWFPVLARYAGLAHPVRLKRICAELVAQDAGPAFSHVVSRADKRLMQAPFGTCVCFARDCVKMWAVRSLLEHAGHRAFVRFPGEFHAMLYHAISQRDDENAACLARATPPCLLEWTDESGNSYMHLAAMACDGGLRSTLAALPRAMWCVRNAHGATPGDILRWE